MTDKLPHHDDHPVALIDRDANTRKVLRSWLETAGFGVVEFARGRDALEREISEWTAVCLDLDLEDMDGFDVLRHLRARDVFLPVLIVTADQEIDSAVRAIRLGAYDYATKPMEKDRILRVLGTAAEYRLLNWRMQRSGQALGGPKLIGSLVGRSAPMRAMARQIERVLESDVPVCIFGETGTGKELVARAIHEQGSRARGPFVPINCAAFTESLLESELFGHEKGSFSGAFTSHRGCFEQAQDGTLFLDEVGEMSPATQVRLLRTLQERTIRRVGGTAEIHVDVRIVAATHRDLTAEVKAGRFREDLYYRLAVYPIHVPPLRDRPADIPLLVEHLCKKLGGEKGRPDQVSPDAIEALTRHRWPGNVRELENVIQRAILSCDGPRIELAHLPPELRSLILPTLPLVSPRPGSPAPGQPLGPEAVVPLRELERREILKALAATHGSVAKAAKLLGLGRATLYRRLGELQIQLEPEPVTTLPRVSGRTGS